MRHLHKLLPIMALWSFTVDADTHETKDVAHVFIIDSDRREIGLLLSGDGNFALPSTEVGADLSNVALEKFIAQRSSVTKLDLHHIARIELTPKTSVFDIHNILSLLGIVKSTSAETQPKIGRITHNYFLSLLKRNDADGFTWISLEDIYRSHNEVGARVINPPETFDLLSMLTAARQGKTLKTEKFESTLSKHFDENNINASVELFVPARLANQYASILNEINQPVTRPKTIDNKSFETVAAIVALPFLLSVAVKHDKCLIQ